MAVTGTDTYRDIITDALRKINVVSSDYDATASEADVARREINRMLKSWQNKGYNLWTKSEQILTLTTADSYTLNPVRPLRILNANLKRNSTETPMIEMTRDEYKTLPNKATTGTPTQFYYDRQREAALFYIWPILAAPAGETIVIDYDREVDDVVNLNDAVDIPGEFYDAVVYGLAARLADSFTVSGDDANRVIARAQILEREALAFDQEGSVFFAGPYAN